MMLNTFSELRGHLDTLFCHHTGDLPDITLSMSLSLMLFSMLTAISGSTHFPFLEATSSSPSVTIFSYGLTRRLGPAKDLLASQQ